MKEKRIRMTLFLIVILISLGWVQSAHAETLYYRTNGKKVGMVDAQGNVVIPIAYSSIEPWGEHLYKVDKGFKSGICNDRGQFVIPVKYYFSRLNDKGRAMIALGVTKNGLIDAEAHFILPCEYKYLFEFSNDASQQAAFGEGSCISLESKELLTTDCRYMGFLDNLSNLAKCGLLDVPSGKVLIPPGQYNFIIKPVNGMARWYITKRSNVTYGYVNIETGESFEVGSVDEKLEKITYMTHSDFHGNVAVVNNGETVYIINRSMEVLRNDYTDVLYSHATHMWVGRRTDGTLDIFDEDGRDKAGFQGYADIILPEDMGDRILFPVKNKDGNWGVLNAEGAVVAPFVYEEISTGRCDVLGVKKGGQWGILSNQGKELLPCCYTEVTMPEENDAAYVWVKKSDSLWYKTNVYTKKESAAGYERVEAFKDGLAWVRPSDLSGQNGILATALVPVESDASQNETTKKNDDEEEEDSAIVPENQDYVQKWGVIINEQGEILFPEAVSAEYLPQIKAAIKKKGGALTRSEAHAFLLKLSADKRMYLMTKKIDDNDWDY